MDSRDINSHSAATIYSAPDVSSALCNVLGGPWLGMVSALMEHRTEGKKTNSKQINKNI